MGNYLSIYLNDGRLSPVGMENPLNLKPDTSNNEFNCFDVIIVRYFSN